MIYEFRCENPLKVSKLKSAMIFLKSPFTTKYDLPQNFKEYLYVRNPITYHFLSEGPKNNKTRDNLNECRKDTEQNLTLINFYKLLRDQE